MTRYRRLKKPPVVVRRGGVGGIFAGVCVAMLLLSGSVIGLALTASGQTYTDLVDENAVNWKVKDVSLDPNPMNPSVDYPVYYWDYGFPERVGEALEFEFNDAADEWFTVYLHNVWEGSLSLGMTLYATFEIRSDSEELPVFESRRDDVWTQVCLSFQTTGGSYVPTDLWWSFEDVILTSYTDGVSSVKLNTPITLAVEIDRENWFNWYGVAGTEEEFSAAIADIHEIGFSFGREGSITSGVALTQGDATFVLTEFSLVPAA